MADSLDGVLTGLSKRIYDLEQRLSNPAVAVGNGSSPTFSNVTIGGSGGAVIGPVVSAPTGLTGTSTAFFESVYIDLTWTAPAGATPSAYEVQWARKTGTTYEAFTSATTTFATYRIQPAEPSSTYGVRVYSIDNVGRRSAPFPSTGWQDISTTKDATIPGQVAGLTVTSGATSIMARWTARTESDIAIYEVEYSTANTFTSPVSNKTASTVMSFTGLDPALTYYFRVRAIDTSNNEGPWSTTASVNPGLAATPKTDGIKPTSSPTPTVNSTIGAIHLAWAHITNADPVTYDIHMSTTSGFTPDTTGTTTLVGSTPGTFFYVQRGPSNASLTYGTTYYFKIIAKDADGSAPAGAQASGSRGQSAAADLTVQVANSITTAQTTADTAVTNAATAQTAANNASTAAGTAQTTADSKGRVWYQATAPAAASSNIRDVWFKTDENYRPYEFVNGAWSARQFGNAAIADNAITAGKVSIQVGGGNQWLNASFETDNNSDGIADDWSIYNNSGLATQEPTTHSLTTGRNGGKAQRVTWTKANTTSKGVYKATPNRVTDQWYVVSIWARASLSIAAGLGLHWNNGPQTVEVVSNPTLSATVWQRYVWRIKWNAGATVDPNTYISATYGVGFIGWIEFDEAQHEIGDVVTEWTPSPSETLALARQGITDAGAAQSTANTANTAAGTAQTAANTAQTAANTAQTAASTAQTTANGKNKVFYATSNPAATGLVVNDLLFRTDEDNKPYQWNGSSWVAQPLGNAAIGNLDAGKITAGTISANRIQAGSITAEKLNVSLGSVNLITNSSAEYTVFGEWADGWGSVEGFSGTMMSSGGFHNGYQRATLTTTATQSSIRTPRVRIEKPATGKTDRYWCSAWVRVAAGATKPFLFCPGIQSNGVTLTYTGLSGTIRYVSLFTQTGSWQRIAGYIDVDSSTNAEFLELRIGLYADPGPSNPANHVLDVDAVMMTKSDFLVAYSPSPGEVQPGTITADHIIAGSLTSESGVFGTISASHITTGTFDAAKVTVTNLSAASITTGTMSGAHITAGTIETTKFKTLVIGKNRVVNGTFQADLANWTGNWENTGTQTDTLFYPENNGQPPLESGRVAVLRTNANVGSSFASDTIPVTPGQVYGIAANLRYAGVPSNAYFRVNFGKSATFTRTNADFVSLFDIVGGNVSDVNATPPSAPVTDTSTRFAQDITIPAGVTHMRISFYSWTQPTGFTYLVVDDVTCALIYAGTTIDGGTITTDEVVVRNINADTITYGTLEGTLIRAKTIDAKAIKTSTLDATTITLAANGVLRGLSSGPGNGGTGWQLNQDGFKIFNAVNGATVVSLNRDGTASFKGDISGASGTFTGNLSGSTITGGVITGSQYWSELTSGVKRVGIGPIYSNVLNSFYSQEYSGGLFFEHENQNNIYQVSGVFQNMLDPAQAYRRQELILRSTYWNAPAPTYLGGSNASIVLRSQRADKSPHSPSGTPDTSNGGSYNRILISAIEIFLQGIVSVRFETSSTYYSIAASSFNQNSVEANKRNIKQLDSSKSVEFVKGLRAVEFNPASGIVEDEVDPKTKKIKQVLRPTSSTRRTRSFIAEEIAALDPTVAAYEQGSTVPMGYDVAAVLTTVTDALQNIIFRVEALEDRSKK